MLVRKAVPADIPAVTAIYGALLDREERGELSTGWTRGVYPTEQTALDALAAGTLYVLEDGGRVAAAAKLDQNQMAQYSQCTWRHDAPPEQVLVLHTLVVDPTVKGKGYGTAFVAFYEQLARETDRPYLRIFLIPFLLFHQIPFGTQPPPSFPIVGIYPCLRQGPGVSG